MAEPTAVNDDHLKRLAEAILSSLEGPAPTPPLAADPVGLPPLHAAAAAMNPQFAPLLLQRANQPNQNLYNQQVMGFEQAMQGRREALAAGASILNTNTKADAILNRPPSASSQRMQEKSYVITGDKAKALGLDPSRGWRVRQIFDPYEGTYTEPEVVGETFIPPTVMQGMVDGKDSLVTVDKSGSGRGSAAPVDDVAPRPPEGRVESISQLTNIMRSIDNLSSNPTIQTGGTGEFLKSTGQEIVRAIPRIGPGISGRIDPDREDLARTLTKIRQEVQLYLTGKATNMQEMSNLMGMIPTIADATNPEFFFRQMDKFKAEFKNTLSRTAQQNPKLFLPDELSSLGITGLVSNPPSGSVTNPGKVDPATLQRARELAEKIKSNRGGGQ